MAENEKCNFRTYTKINNYPINIERQNLRR